MSAADELHKSLFDAIYHLAGFVLWLCSAGWSIHFLTQLTDQQLVLLKQQLGNGESSVDYKAKVAAAAVSLRLIFCLTH